MSEQSKADLDAAAAAHFADECDGAMLTGYVLQAVGSTADDINDASVRMLREVPDTQSIVTTLGLIDNAKTTVGAQVTSWVGQAEEDDE